MQPAATDVELQALAYWRAFKTLVLGVLKTTGLLLLTTCLFSLMEFLFYYGWHVVLGKMFSKHFSGVLGIFGINSGVAAALYVAWPRARMTPRTFRRAIPSEIVAFLLVALLLYGYFNSFAFVRYMGARAPSWSIMIVTGYSFICFATAVHPFYWLLNRFNREPTHRTAWPIDNSDLRRLKIFMLAVSLSVFGLTAVHGGRDMAQAAWFLLVGFPLGLLLAHLRLLAGAVVKERELPIAAASCTLSIALALYGLHVAEIA